MMNFLRSLCYLGWESVFLYSLIFFPITILNSPFSSHHLLNCQTSNLRTVFQVWKVNRGEKDTFAAQR